MSNWSLLDIKELVITEYCISTVCFWDSLTLVIETCVGGYDVVRAVADDLFFLDHLVSIFIE